MRIKAKEGLIFEKKKQKDDVEPGGT